METIKNAGIWMDHSDAQLIDLNAPEKKHSFTSEFTFNTKEEALKKGESHMHNKKQQMHEAYYKEIAEAILHYDHVLLFGPTHAKTELYNFVEKDSHFKDIKIDVKAADKMTNNERVAFVKDHFKK